MYDPTTRARALLLTFALTLMSGCGTPREADGPAPGAPATEKPASPHGQLSRRPWQTLESGIAGGEYTVALAVGTPPRTFEVVVDTGSANLVLLGGPEICSGCPESAAGRFDPARSSTAQDSGETFSIRYGSGSLAARELRDRVAVAGQPAIDITFGVMTEDTGVPNILGLAYRAVAQPAAAPLEPYFDTLVRATGLADEFSLLLCDGKGSRIVFGPSDMEAESYVPLSEETYYAISSKALRLAGDKGASLGELDQQTLVDSGTTALIVPQKILDAILAELQKTAYREGLGRLAPRGRVHASERQIRAFPTLELVTADATGKDVALRITPETYFEKTSHDQFILMIHTSPVDKILLGQVFLKNYLVRFDRAGKRLGFTPSAELCG